MPEYLRSLLVVLSITVFVYAALQRSFRTLMPAGAYERRRNAFLALTICGFLAPGFWFFALAASGIVLLAARRESNVPALFLAVLFVVPPAGAQIPGLGLINFLLQLDYPRLLALLLLLPLAVALHRKPAAPGPLWADRLFAAYLLLLAGLGMARAATLTNSLRGAVYLLIDVFLPYYVMSRAFTDTEKLKDALATFCVSGTVLAAIGIFEALKHWLLYRALLDRWSTDFGMGNYMLREGLIRATAGTGHSIVLGYVLMVAFACFLALRSELRNGMHTKLLCAVLLAGLLVTMSRGPWVGTAVTAFGFWATANASRMRMGLAVGGVGVLASVFDLQLPTFSVVQNVDASTIQYRSELLSASIQVFGEHPWLGSDHFVERLAEMGMVQGEGIVDIVNTYVGVALSSGAVGLALFAGLFATVLLGLLRAKQEYDSEDARQSAEAQRGARSGDVSSLTAPPRFSPSIGARALFASILGIAVTIGTASSILGIPWVYWAWLGTSVGVMRTSVRKSRERAKPTRGVEKFSSMSQDRVTLS